MSPILASLFISTGVDFRSLLPFILESNRLVKSNFRQSYETFVLTSKIHESIDWDVFVESVTDWNDLLIYLPGVNSPTGGDPSRHVQLHR